MKKAAAAGLIAMFLTVSNGWAIPEAADLTAPPPGSLSKPSQAIPYAPVSLFEKKEEKTNPAYEHYKRRPSSEFSKLLYLGEMLKQGDRVVLYDGSIYIPRVIAPLVAVYMRMNYKKETAEEWIRKYTYRNGPANSIIYLKDRRGKVTVLRDYLLEELKSI